VASVGLVGEVDAAGAPVEVATEGSREARVVAAAMAVAVVAVVALKAAARQAAAETAAGCQSYTSRRRAWPANHS
jgi:hypothetical protein